MARLDVNRSGELEVFIRVIELGGFSAAARAFGMTPSAVSKLVARLEQRLGTRLVNRSTRQLQLTAEGCVFYERGISILSDLDEAERCASVQATPRGRVRVSANVPFGHRFLLPLVPAFIARHPEVSLDITLTDEVIDLLEQRTDVAVRAGPLKDSTLVARPLGRTRMVVAASPAYVAARGLPLHPEELGRHNLLASHHVRAQHGWPMRRGSEEYNVMPLGNVQASDGEALHRLVLAGVGMARLAAFQAHDDIAAGSLLQILEDWNPGDIEDIHAVFVGQGGHLPQRVRAFLDFLAENVTIPGD